MEPAGRIDPPSWMTEPATRRVLDAVAAGGRPVRFVGGCVRDAILGRPVGDLDLATPEMPERVLALLRDAGLKAVATGLDHGTVTAVTDARAIEITTLRHDVETDGRHAVVAFTDDWAADAARRDFTINALFCAADGTVYDPVGGWPDLRAGRVRFVGDPDRRIREDYLRILRFFRFQAHYGAGASDPAALAAAGRHAEGLTRIAAERRRAELLKLLAAPDPTPVVKIMQTHGVLAQISHGLSETDTLETLVGIEQAMNQTPDALRRLGALLQSSPNAATAVAEGLRLSRHQVSRLAALRQPSLPSAPVSPGPALRAALYRDGPRTVRDRMLVAAAIRARSGEALDHRRLAAALAEIDAWTPKELPVDGADVKALGVSAGPRVGALLRAVEDWWLARDFEPDRQACLARLRDLVAME